MEFNQLRKCYVCNQEFDGVTVKDHREHVIQNAIGGGLTAEGILCAACGANLGNSVDKDFNLALNSLCAVFDIRRDRGGDIKVPARVTFKRGIQIEPPNPKFSIVRGGDPTPTGPLLVKIETTKTVHVFGANSTQARQFAKSEKVKGLEDAGHIVELESSISPFVETVALDIRLDGLELARGVLKIAIAFALKVGVDPVLIRHFVVDDGDLTSDRSKIESAVGPYYPTGWCEAAFEADRYATDEFPPNHQLALFNLDDRLFCHVDLFGVIQRYVLLSEHWSGEDIRERYVQKCPKWIYDPNNWVVRKPKDILILSQQFGVETAERTWEEIQAEILQKVSSRPYELLSDNHLKMPERILSQLALLPMDQHAKFPTTSALRERMEIAQKEFGSSFLTTLARDRLLVFLFLKNLDCDLFRITNENGACPDLSRDTSETDLRRYQQFRLDEFVREFAVGWQIELKADDGSN